MSYPQKKYFLTPNWSYPPLEADSIALGSIIASPAKAWPPLATATTDPLSDSSLSSISRDSIWSKYRADVGAYGIYNKFLETLLGAGPSSKVSLQMIQHVDFSFDSTTTQDFWPSPTYVKQQIKQPAVQAYIDSQSSSKFVYMIIGIKYVTGSAAKRNANMAQTERRLSAPVELTAEAMMRAMNEEMLAPVNNADDFVFAFKVARIEVKQTGQRYYTKPSQSRAMHDGSFVTFPDEIGNFYEIGLLNDGGVEVNEEGEKIFVSLATDYYE